MTRERRDRILESVFQVRPKELPLMVLLLSYCTCAVGAFIVGRSLRDALFLAQLGRGQLPLMYALSAMAVTAAGLVYARVADRIRRDRMASWTAIGFAVLSLLIRIATNFSGAWIYALLYVFVEVMGALVTIQFWSLANDIFHSRDARRLFGTIGTGGTVANVLLGAFVGGIANTLGAVNLLVIVAALLGGCAVLARLIGRRVPLRVSMRARPTRSAATPTGAAVRVFRSPYLRVVAALAVVTYLATTLVDFQFKVTAASSFSQDSLAAFFGIFYAVTGVLALVVQLVGTSRLLARFGVTVGLALLPASIGLGATMLLIWPGLASASVTRGADNLFRYTINDATTQLLYVPVPANARGGAKAFIDGVIKPASIAGAGLLLTVYRGQFEVRTAPLAVTMVILCVVWLGVLAALRSRYITSLQDNLRRRQLDLDAAKGRMAEGATARVLGKALESADSEEVLNALALLPQVPRVDVDDRVERLLSHPRPDVRIASLGHLGTRGSLRFGNAVYRLFDDPDAGVRAAAVSAFCAIGREKAVRSVRAYLGDPSPAIRGAAIIGMIRYGGLDGVLAAAEALKELIGHQEPLMRQHAARVLGAIGVRNFYQPVLELMADPDVTVRRAAVQAAGALKAPELAPALVYRLAREETARDAVDALTAFGPGIEPMLGRVLENRAEDPQIRRNATRVLGRLGTALAVETITRHLQDSDELLRRRLYQALAKALRTRQERAANRKAVLAALDNELKRAYAAIAAGEALGLPAALDGGAGRNPDREAAALLGAALREKIAQTEERLFLLLGIIYPDAGLETAYAALKDASGAEAIRRRATAIELVDNVASRELRRKLLPLLDDGPVPTRLRAASLDFPSPPRSLLDHLKALIDDEAAWVRACAAWYSARDGTHATTGEVARLLDHPWEVVRETAMAALELMVPRSELVHLIRSRLHDDSPRIRIRAAALVS
jgi:ATP:ADP antiporter, AAA family